MSEQITDKANVTADRAAQLKPRPLTQNQAQSDLSAQEAANVVFENPADYEGEDESRRMLSTIPDDESQSWRDVQDPELVQYPEYVFDQKEFEYSIKDDGVTYSAILKAPNKQIEKEREKKVKNNKVFGTREVEVADEENPDKKVMVTYNSMVTQSSVAYALTYYFNKTAQQVKGYILDEGDNRETWLDVKQVIDQETQFGKMVDVRILDTIPDLHKIKLAAQLYGGDLSVEETKKRTWTLRSKRTYTVTWKVGAIQQPDGNLSKPTHIVEFDLLEPSAQMIQMFEQDGMPGESLFDPKDSTKQIEERKVDLDVMRQIFDLSIKDIRGARFSIGPVDLSNHLHLGEIPLAIKKNVVAMLFDQARRKVGN